MDFDAIIEMVDYTINSKRRRHITGGILLSVSLLFGGLAFTVWSTKLYEEEKKK